MFTNNYAKGRALMETWELLLALGTFAVISTGAFWGILVFFFGRLDRLSDETNNNIDRRANDLNRKIEKLDTKIDTVANDLNRKIEKLDTKIGDVSKNQAAMAETLAAIRGFLEASLPAGGGGSLAGGPPGNMSTPTQAQAASSTVRAQTG